MEDSVHIDAADKAFQMSFYELLLFYCIRGSLTLLGPTRHSIFHRNTYMLIYIVLSAGRTQFGIFVGVSIACLPLCISQGRPRAI